MSCLPQIWMNAHPLLLHACISAPTRMVPSIAHAGMGSEQMESPRASLQVDAPQIHTCWGGNLGFSRSSKIKPIIIKQRRTKGHQRVNWLWWQKSSIIIKRKIKDVVLSPSLWNLFYSWKIQQILHNSFQLKKWWVCLPGGAVTLLTVQRGSLGLVNVKSRHFDVVQTLVPNPVTLISDVAQGLFFWADNMGNIYKSDGQQSSTLYSGRLQYVLLSDRILLLPSGPFDLKLPMASLLPVPPQQVTQESPVWRAIGSLATCSGSIGGQSPLTWWQPTAVRLWWFSAKTSVH